MYESHFGFDGPPFGAEPDPRFFFEGRGQHAALAELRRALAVHGKVSLLRGEAGSGKTLLMRLLLAENQAAQADIGLIDAQGLSGPALHVAMAVALGFPAADAAGAPDPQAMLARHLTEMVMSGRRPMLLVDNTHELSLDDLNLLLEVQSGGPLGLASVTMCLAGEPALATALRNKELTLGPVPLEGSCMLAPLDAGETGAYVRHRLRVVGWKRLPRFEAGAFEALHRGSGGVPLRINRLCHQVILSRYLESQVHVDGDTVDEAVQALLTDPVADRVADAPPVSVPGSKAVATEPVAASAVTPSPPSEPIFEPPSEPPLPPAVEPQPLPASAVPAFPAGELPVLTEALAVATPPAAPGASSAARDVADSPTLPPPNPRVGGGPRPLLCVVGGQADHIKAAALWRALAARNDLPVMMMVRAYANNAYVRHSALFDGIDTDGRLVGLGIGGGPTPARAAELTQRFEFVLDQCQPCAVIVFDGSDAALSCGLVAQRRSVPVVQVGAGLRGPGEPGRPGAADNLTRKLTDELSTVLYTADPQAADRLTREGIPFERIVFAGNLLIDSLRHALRGTPPPRVGPGGPPPDIAGVPPALLADRNGYAVVVLHGQANLAERAHLTDLIALLRGVSHDVPLIWPMHARVREQLAKFRLEGTLAGDRIACLPLMAYPPFAQLLSHATCVLTDSWNVQEEATALGLPCMTIGLEPECPITSTIGSNTYVGTSRSQATRAVWNCIFNGGKRGQVPEQWDGHTGARIAEHLSLWLREHHSMKAALGAFA